MKMKVKFLAGLIYLKFNFKHWINLYVKEVGNDERIDKNAVG